MRHRQKMMTSSDAGTAHRDGTLRRAVFDGRPGHPVVLGRRHWAPLLGELTGDSGARAYLAARDVVEIECADLGTGLDVDRA